MKAYLLAFCPGDVSHISFALYIVRERKKNNNTLKKCPVQYNKILICNSQVDDAVVTHEAQMSHKNECIFLLLFGLRIPFGLVSSFPSVPDNIYYNKSKSYQRMYILNCFPSAPRLTTLPILQYNTTPLSRLDITFPLGSLLGAIVLCLLYCCRSAAAATTPSSVVMTVFVEMVLLALEVVFAATPTEVVPHFPVSVVVLFLLFFLVAESAPAAAAAAATAPDSTILTGEPIRSKTAEGSSSSFFGGTLSWCGCC